MKNKFNVGDEVVAKKDAPYGITTNGWKGVVMAVIDECRIGVVDVTGKDATIFSVKSEHFDFIEDRNKIVITVEGRTVLARRYYGPKVVKTAIAKCSPEDDFDFMIGAKLAFDRLHRKYAPGDKVKVIRDTCYHGYKIGSILTLRKKRDLFDNTWYTNEGSSYIYESDFVYMEKSDDAAINVGDIVKIVDTGRIYTTNKRWMLEHVHDDELKLQWAYGASAGYPEIRTLSDKFEVKVVAENIALVQRKHFHNNACYIINLDGIEKC